jgi:hypothetical protein
VVDENKDGDKESHNGVGCMIAGMLHVQRAPGGIVIQAQSGVKQNVHDCDFSLLPLRICYTTPALILWRVDCRWP